MIQPKETLMTTQNTITNTWVLEENIKDAAGRYTLSA